MQELLVMTYPILQEEQGEGEPVQFIQDGSHLVQFEEDAK